MAGGSSIRNNRYCNSPASSRAVEMLKIIICRLNIYSPGERGQLLLTWLTQQLWCAPCSSYLPQSKKTLLFEKRCFLLVFFSLHAQLWVCTVLLFSCLQNQIHELSNLQFWRQSLQNLDLFCIWTQGGFSHFLIHQQMTADVYVIHTVVCCFLKTMITNFSFSYPCSTVA